MKTLTLSTGSFDQVNEVINSVTKAIDGAHVGAVLTSKLDDEYGFYYVMWATVSGRRHSEQLRVQFTDEKRLAAHWKGFIDNIEEAGLKADATLLANEFKPVPDKSHNVCYAPRCNNVQLAGQCVCAEHAAMVAPAKGSVLDRVKADGDANALHQLLTSGHPAMRFAKAFAKGEMYDVVRDDQRYMVIHDGKVVEPHVSEAAAWAYVFDILDCMF